MALRKIGQVTTDSGLLYVGGPEWDKPDANDIELYRKPREVELGEKGITGVVIPTHSDGDFPVYAKTKHTGRPSDVLLRRVIFDFTDERTRNPSTHIRTVAAGLLLLSALVVFRTKG